MAFDRSLAIVVSAVLVSGCALAIQGPDSTRPRRQVPRCDTAKSAVALDGIIAAGLGIGALGALGEDAEGAGVVLLATSALFVATAVRGSRVADECRAAFGEYRASAEEVRRDPVVTQLRRPRPVKAAPVVVEAEPATPTPAKPAHEPAPAPAFEDDTWSAFWVVVP